MNALTIRSDRMLPAFRASSNLVIGTLAIIAVAFTRDWMMGGVCLAVELLYLGAASVWTLRCDADVSGRENFLLVIGTLGVAAVAFFGFGHHNFSIGSEPLSHSAGWEVGALVWTFIFIFYYFFKVEDTSIALVNRFAFFLIPSIGLVCLYRAISDIHQPIKHLVYVLGSSGSLLVADTLLWRFPKSDNAKVNARQMLFMADYPTVIAFFVLLVFLNSHQEAEHTDAFLSGAISMQMIYSNVIFIQLELNELSRLRNVPSGAARQAAAGSGNS